MMQILRTSQMLSICRTIKRYIQTKKKNYISQEKRRDIFVFAFLTVGFLTLCQRGRIQTHARGSAGGLEAWTHCWPWTTTSCASPSVHIYKHNHRHIHYPTVSGLSCFLENISTYTSTTKVVLF